MPTPRTTDLIADQHRRAVASLKALNTEGTGGSRRLHDLEVMRAVRDSLAWVLGLSPAAPLTGRHLPGPSSRQIFSEHAKAEAIVNGGRRPPEGVSWTYVSAVEHALYWARGSATNPPADQAASSLPLFAPTD